MDESKYYPLRPRNIPSAKPPIDTSSTLDDYSPRYKGAPVEFTPFSMFVIAFHEYPDATNIEEKKQFLKMWDVVIQDKNMDFPTFFAHELNPYKDNLDRAETFYFLARGYIHHFVHRAMYKRYKNDAFLELATANMYDFVHGFLKRFHIREIRMPASDKTMLLP